MAFLSEIAAAEYYIRLTLKGSVALSAFTSTIEPQPLPRGSALPAVTYTLLHAAYENTLNGVRVYGRLAYRIVAIGEFSTIATLAQMDSIIQGLFNSGQEARVNYVTPYGTIMAMYATHPHSLSYLDPGDDRLMRYLGTTFMVEVKST